MSLDDTALRLASSPFRISQHIKKDSIRIGIKTFHDFIIRTGLQYGMTMRQLAKLQIKSDDDNAILISLRYHGPTKGDKPRQKWFISPKGGSNPRGGPQALFWQSLTGSKFFSKGHFVTGTDARWVIDRAVKNGLKRFKEDLKGNTEQFLEATKIG